MSNAKAIGTPKSPSRSLDKDEKGNSVDEAKYHGMIDSLLYLIASRPYIMFSVCKCARFQLAPKESHLTPVKRIIRHLIRTISYGLWNPRSNNFKLEFSDDDLVGDTEDRKSTSGTYQLLGKALISWNSKKQGSIALSTAEAEYIAIGQSQYVDIKHHFIRDHVTKESIELSFVSTIDQLAGIFTKPLLEDKFCTLRELLGIVSLNLKN
ncbi:secreted RxLR effector protein 161-like [Nicotiana tabacum]|uniref:Secreted RxLR effector protein 161-like n=1 Tax=Nicotiana tabacum TaxID=4097 RepID=A0AC58UC66_TOBAC